MKCIGVLEEVDRELLRGLVRDIGIPARPSLLVDIQSELNSGQPALARLSRLASADPAISAALIRAANSPWMGLLRPADTVERAISFLGMRQFETILMELALHTLMPDSAMPMEPFWAAASQRSLAMVFLARQHLLCPADIAHACGLFLDIGMPLMAAHDWDLDYRETLAFAASTGLPLTEVERRRHGTDHAMVGASMARSWGVSQTAVIVVRLHHDHQQLQDPQLPQMLRNLLAMTLLAEHLVAHGQGSGDALAWRRAGAAAMDILGLDDQKLRVWTEEVRAALNGTPP